MNFKYNNSMYTALPAEPITDSIFENEVVEDEENIDLNFDKTEQKILSELIKYDPSSTNIP